MQNLSIDTLARIVSNDKLQLNTEDQLLKFVNKLYKSDSIYSILYETVLFENVTGDVMKEFTQNFDSEDMNRRIWIRLSNRLENEIEKEEETVENKRYRQKSDKIHKKKKRIEFSPSGQKDFNGILNHLRTETNGQIESKVAITSSSICNSSENHQPRVVTLFEDKNKYFYTNIEQNCWLRFEFRESRVVPTHYTIRSYQYNSHPKSWVIECSNDRISWETVDEESECPHLASSSPVHTFKVNHPTSKGFRYVRMRLTGPNWSGNNQLVIDSFEIYGNLTSNQIKNQIFLKKILRYFLKKISYIKLHFIIKYYFFLKYRVY